MTKFILASAMFAFFTLINPAQAADQIYTGLFNNKAVGGYDTVAYHTVGKPVKGSKEFKTEYKGANWFFSSQENLDLFTANPEKYAPQYGGYCAWAAAHDTLAKGDPKHWHIEDGKLYLNYDKKTHSLWLPRRAELVPVADEAFTELLKEE